MTHQLIESIAESIGYNTAIDKWNNYAATRYNTTDPFKDPTTHKKLKAPPNSTKQETKTWKLVQSKAWTHDRCFMGCAPAPVDTGIGLGALVVLIPGIGPLLMYIVHARLISVAGPLQLPPDTIATMNANIVFDFLITLPPVVGSLFSWMNGCSTRNAVLVYNHLCRRVDERCASGLVGSVYIGQFGDWEGEQQEQQEQQAQQAQQSGLYS